jgi:hypothetical protein
MSNKFFSESNDVNEAIVVGTVLLAPFVIGYFIPSVTPEKFKVMSQLVGACFLIGAGKAAAGFFAQK